MSGSQGADIKTNGSLKPLNTIKFGVHSPNKQPSEEIFNKRWVRYLGHVSAFEKCINKYY